MVTIIYIKELDNNKFDSKDYPDIGSFILENFVEREQILDLRFFHDELLGQEINQSNGDFLSIDNGTIVVAHDSQIPRGPETWIYVAIAVVTAIVAAMALKPEIPDVSQSATAKSATNRLGETSNEARINQRIDDVYGKVTKHIPTLWQVPYRIGINNQEVEVLYLCVGRGKYAINAAEWYDGDTPVTSIDNAAVSVYGPNTSPRSGHAPALQIGPAINQEIGIYRLSNDLNSSELIPPNENLSAGIKWRATGTTSSVILNAVTIPDGVSLTTEYTVGQQVKVNNMVYAKPLGILSLYYLGGTFYTAMPFYKEPVDLSEGNSLVYTVSSVSASSITLTIPASASTTTKTAWNETNDYSFPETLIELSTSYPTRVYVTDKSVYNDDFYENDVSSTHVRIHGYTDYNYSVGTDNSVIKGPFVIPKGATKVLINLVSANGLYKIIDGVENIVSAQIRIVIRELNSSGVPTGVNTVINEVQSSNGDNVRGSVFRTVKIDLPYTYCTVEAQRVTERDKRSGVSNVDTVEWRDLYSFEPITVTQFGNVTTAHVMIPSNSASRLIKQRKQNVTLTRLITQYLGNNNFGPVESFAAESFDQILISMALDPYIGRLSLSEINADGLLALKTQIINYFGSDTMVKFGHVFDNLSMTFQDIFLTVCNAVFCTPYSQYGIYDAVFEKLQTSSLMQITCRNKIMNSESRTYNYDKKFDGVEITYRSNETGTSDTVYLPADQSATNPERITVNGCTTLLQAYRYAWRVRNKQLYELCTVKFDVDDFGRNIIPSLRIDSPDSTRFTPRSSNDDGYRVFDGEVVDVNSLDVELSEPVIFTSGEDHYITFTTIDGGMTSPVKCTRIDDYTVRLTALPSQPIYVGYERDRTKFVFVSEQLRQSIALIPKTIEFNLSDDGSEIHTVTSVNYDSRYYQNDLSNP